MRLPFTIGLVWVSLAGGGLALADKLETVLLQSAVVSGESIRLSDLLPGGAPSHLQAAARGVVLGRAPIPARGRLLERSAILRQLARAGISTTDVRVPDHITVWRRSRPIDQERLRKAIADYLRLRGQRDTGLPAAADWQSSGQVAAEEEETLVVQAAEWDAGAQLLRFRVRCRRKAQCGSFFAWSKQSWQGPQPWLDTGKSPGLSSAPAQPRPPLVHAGEHALLQFEEKSIRVSFPVVCLERGAAEQRIRVRDVAQGRIYYARVIGQGRLRGVSGPQ